MQRALHGQAEVHKGTQSGEVGHKDRTRNHAHDKTCRAVMEGLQRPVWGGKGLYSTGINFLRT